ncbi:MAG: helix-turn-helix domain-containing protein [Clostridium sp.]|uniref:helix-turn-helix domain-containing protein n=1 Tax=Clostridium sp. TaxID=1506 RepID=UPI0029087A02|nr:helix-turn-helix domain-containing protein [Clostridium sp.]MDU7337977.1 helix-turn-helix domain-containing protein [Clostridium sp.]
MTQYVTGTTIKYLREKKGYTQRQLAELLTVSDKAVSKWENRRGLPDISLLEPLAKALNVSVAELLSGEQITNSNRAGNMLRTCFYVCPVCGNVIHSLGEGSFTCCGITLPVQEAEESDEPHLIQIQKIENEYYITLNHPMEKDHYISFLALISPDQIQMKKLYPEQSPDARFAITGSAVLYVYCNQHGLYRTEISYQKRAK